MAKRQFSATTPEPSGVALGDLLGYQLQRATVAANRNFAINFGDLPLRPTQVAILLSVAERPGVSQRALCTELDVKPANMVSQINELAERGLLLREVNPDDRRAQCVTLGDAAIPLMPVIAERLQTHRAHFRRMLGVENEALLLEMLQRLWASETPEDPEV